MQTGTLVLGILLAGQLGDAGGPRYPSGSAAPPLRNNAIEAGQNGAGQQPPLTQQPATSPAGSNPLHTQNPAAATAPPAGLSNGVKPGELFRTLLKPAGAEKLAGTPLSLAEAVQGASSRAEQTRRVKLYWELSQAVAGYHLVSLESVQLKAIHEGLAQGRVQPGLVWQQARQAVVARSEVARGAVLAAQLRLQEELGRQGNRSLPLPSDVPHCGAYETRFNEIFRGRASDEAEQLSKLLPLRRQELGQRALDTLASHEWYNLVSQQRSPQSDGRQLLKAYEHLALQRRTFVTTAYQYNEEIARYTELAVPQDVGAVRLVAMLIESDGSFSGQWQRDGGQRNGDRGGIRQTVAEEALPTNGSQRTFAQGGRSRALRVPAKEDSTERSILVSPKK